MDTGLALKRLEAYLDEKQLVSKGDKLVLGVSGGADSTALLYLFVQLRPKLDLSLLAVHVNHQLRAEESDADETAVKKFCLAWNVPLIVRKIKIGNQASLEDQARKARFKVFDEVMANYHYDKIALAHHREDQAETVLINLLRGSGINGLAGIKPQSGIVIHPLLGFSRSDLEKLLSQKTIGWQTDNSNQDNSFTRNRIRNDLLPKLRSEYNPSLNDHLCSLAEIFLQVEQLMTIRSRQQQRRHTLESSPARQILEIEPLLKLSQVERYYIFRHAFRVISQKETDFMASHVNAIDEILQSQGSKVISLPHGVKVHKIYGELCFSRETPRTEVQETSMEIDTDRARAVFGNYRFTFRYVRNLPAPPEPENQHLQIIIDAEKINTPFTIRFRQPGDRFIPFGMNQFKKLKEFFIDEKVPKFERDLIPILDDGEKIFWIVGLRIDNRVRRDEGSSRFLHIVAEPLHVKPNRAIHKKKRGNYESDEL